MMMREPLCPGFRLFERRPPPKQQSFTRCETVSYTRPSGGCKYLSTIRSAMHYARIIIGTLLRSPSAQSNQAVFQQVLDDIENVLDGLRQGSISVLST